VVRTGLEPVRVLCLLSLHTLFSVVTSATDSL